jgi:hypothetical protein
MMGRPLVEPWPFREVAPGERWPTTDADAAQDDSERVLILHGGPVDAQVQFIAQQLGTALGLPVIPLDADRVAYSRGRQPEGARYVAVLLRAGRIVDAIATDRPQLAVRHLTVWKLREGSHLAYHT